MKDIKEKTLTPDAGRDTVLPCKGHCLDGLVAR
jgi:hypothetical protein